MKFFINIFVFLTCQIFVAQESVKVFEKHYIKQNKILFRIVPASKKTFDQLENKSLKITRFELNNNQLSNEVVIVEKLNRFSKFDTTNWLRLLKKEKNKMGFVYKALYEEQSLSKNNSSQKESELIYNLMLLTCDFDADAATACGLFFTDSTIKTNSNYLYKIAIYTSSNSINYKGILDVSVNTSSLSFNKQITGMTAKCKNKICNIKWKASEYSSDYSGYDVERSEDSIHFKKVNKSPVILMTSQVEKKREYIFYTDTLPEINKKYFYRVRGINFFGELSEPSNTEIVLGFPIIKSTPTIDTLRVINNSSVHMSWKMGILEENQYIKKFTLSKSTLEKGPYKVLFETSNKLSFTDDAPGSGNFYKVAAVTQSNDTLYSFSKMAVIIDTIPPLVPFGLKALSDSLGIIKITWNKNKETDLQGYKLFTANSKSEEMIQINSKFITDTSFVVKRKLNTLTNRIYFSLCSVDNNFNNSVRCEKIEVKLPDTIRPIAPNLISASPLSKGVKIKFIRSSSEDIFKHILTRKSYSSNSTLNLKEFFKSDSLGFYLDSTAECGNAYSYQISAFDDSGNQSNSNTIDIKYETGLRKKLSSVNFYVDRKLKNVSLVWEYDLKGIEKFIVYRAKENEPLSIIKTITGSERIYIDKTPNIGNVYEYRIKAVLFNGAESIISDAIKVIY